MIILSTSRNLELTFFQRRLKRLEQNVLRMGSFVETSFRLSYQALFSRDLSAAKEISIVELQIDQYYRQIEEECIALLTLQAPVAGDLRLICAFMQLVRDLERIGDCAQELGEIAIKLFPYQPHPCLSEIALMSQHAQAMLAKSLAALASLNAVSGLEVKHLDNIVDNAYESIYHTLAHQRNVSGVMEPTLLLVLVIRHLERMADRATNIGQRVAYIVTGKRL